MTVITANSLIPFKAVKRKRLTGMTEHNLWLWSANTHRHIV